ncbi:MAG: PKD domain-containing protein [Candidatus Pacearchaeota archaeon]
MKKELLFLGFLILIGFSMASISVNNYTFKDSYVSGDTISGKINLTLRNEEINIKLTSSEDDEITLGNFLEVNNADYTCSPKDCSDDYKTLSGSTSKDFSKDFDDVYAGFILFGDDVEVTGLDFSIESDFYSTIENPLRVEFFEEYEWKFNKFSLDKFTPEDSGCFNGEVSTAGPLIRTSTYCELIYLSETNSVFAGAKVDNGDSKSLKMSIYTEQGHFLGDCSFNPIVEEGCKINIGEIFSSGKYQICVGSETNTNYKIYEETEEPTCGFVHSSGPSSSTKDYGIFAKTAQYADSENFSSYDINFEDYISGANYIINKKYEGDCSDGCILPLRISGIPQTIKISNIALDYLKDNEDYVENKIYELEIIPAQVNFNGSLDLSKTDFQIKNEGVYRLYLGGKEILEEDVVLLPAPEIISFFPTNPPAGIPVTFYLRVAFSGSYNNLEYRWNFGDGKILKTNKGKITYTFPEIKDYDVSVEVSSGGNLSSKKNFSVSAISPEDAIDYSINQRKNSLEQINSYFNKISDWYRDSLRKELNISFYEQNLLRLEEDREDAKTDEDFLRIANEIYSMDFFSSIYTESRIIPAILTSRSEVNANAVASFFEESNPSNPGGYVGQILTWQRENIDARVGYKKIIFLRESGDEEIFRHYNLNLKSNSDEESYFVINAPKESLYFKENSLVKSSDGSSGILIGSNERKVIEFYSLNPEETSFFVSPRLSSMILEEDIDENCNFNLVCEPEFGEDWENCRSDCKPKSRALFYVIIVFLIMLVIYVFLQLWYKKHYEIYLFGDDRSQIYNLLMYVANSRARGIKDGEIVKSLKNQGWNSEKVNYIMKKSYGKNVGLIEIIPFSKISAFLRNREAKNNLNNPNRVVEFHPRNFGQ